MMKYEDMTWDYMHKDRYTCNRITAAGMNRILFWLNNCDCATISAERNYISSKIQELGSYEFGELPRAIKDQYKVPASVNKANTKLMERKIAAMSYGYIKIKGMYIDLVTKKPQAEESFFVFDKGLQGNLKQNMLKLANQFHQDSITFAKAGGNFSLYETTPFSDLPNQPLHGPSGKVLAHFHGVHFESYLKDDVEPYYQMTTEQKIKRKSERALKEEKQFLEYYSQIRGKKFIWDKMIEVNASTNEAKKILGAMWISEEGRLGLRVGSFYRLMSDVRLALTTEPKLL